MICKGNFEQLINRLSQSLKDSNDLYFSYGIHDRDMITTGNEKDFKFLHLSGLPVYNIGRNGGTIVHSIGDISGIIMQKDHNFCHEFPIFLIQKLQGLGINASNNANDIIIDSKYKVAGFSYRKLNDGRYYVTFQVSINCNPLIIKIVCQDALKQPAGLLKYGITSQMVESWLLEFFNQHYQETEVTYLDNIEN